MVVKDSSEWVRGAVECVRALIGGCRGLGEGGKAEAVKAAMRVILEAVEGVSRFRDRRAGAGSRQQAARFAFFAALCLLAVVRGISRAEARTMTRILSRWREK